MKLQVQNRIDGIKRRAERVKAGKADKQSTRKVQKVRDYPENSVLAGSSLELVSA